MTPREAKTAINAAFRALAVASNKSALSQELFDKSFRAALEQEKGHRRRGRNLNPDRYRNSAEVAARYFVVRDFLEPATVDDALDAATLNLTALYSAALRLELGAVPSELDTAAMGAVDYVDHISQPPAGSVRKRSGRARRASRDDWQREHAMQLGMGLGAQAYNEAMGYE